ncbi:putative MFS family arabinose efflux permease [Reinekea marinisedimentorum]|uniref:Putative MFS family arabinose efflux permease n=2 Tax=Reinekea marinisedimentorum TaxID=230495 RepID=A0A4R3I989_9GAMM|nr:putative MFS family arabinose efflux permease [Reinekea marinisedimentorum]
MQLSQPIATQTTPNSLSASDTSISRLGGFTLLLVATLTIMVGAVLAPGLSSISQAMGMSEYAALLITLPALGVVLLAPVFGLLIDKWGARRTLMLSLSGYFIFGSGGAFLTQSWLIMLDRLILGGFAAGAMASGTALISQWYSGKARLGMIAKQGMAIELGGVIFLFVSGLLTEWNWRAPFLIYGFAAVILLLALATIPKQQQNADKQQKVISHSSGRPVKSVLLYAMLSMATFYSMFVSLPGHLGTVGFSEAQVGYFLAFISFMAVIAAMLMPRMITQTNESTTLATAFICFAIAHALFGLSTAVPVIILAAVITGIGFGFSIPLLNHSMVERSTERNRGRNLSYFAMAVFIGQFLTSALSFIPLSSQGIFFVCAAIALICAIKVSYSKALQP